MHTVALTHAFERAAAGAGMSEDEIQVLVDFLAENAGDVMAGTGGCRKLQGADRASAVDIARSRSTRARTCRCS